MEPIEKGRIHVVCQNWDLSHIIDVEISGGRYRRTRDQPWMPLPQSVAGVPTAYVSGPVEFVERSSEADFAFAYFKANGTTPPMSVSEMSRYDVF